ncbi:DUF4350 domain-containing protein [Geobacter pelophilus]|uniref:DUF4350 domain-containing protein n=1 Tax=Geoanaerobacter pelophilus TaxID=60036 RepID=A0AAW4L6K2_9BACT|nr:DUF4350 domain-containing protein [Geoanaerobacter pelophilus]MBT0663442.1 DUF4350 domain-containing protein [Geoanaerobacter pelophilus]
MPRLIKVLLTAVLSLMSILPAMAEDLPVVMFDQGHNQRFLTGKEGPLHLSGLAGVFKEQGFKVETLDGPMTKDALTGAQALVISGAFNTFPPEELEAIAAYLDKGGKLAVMLHIGPPLVPLLDMLGVIVSGSVIHEQENLVKTDDINFKVTRLEAGPLTSGIEQFSLYGGWALLNERPGTTVVAKTGEKAWIDLNGDRKLSQGDAVQEFAVIVSGSYGNGKFVIFADDAIFQNQYLDENNAKLAANLATWLK